MKAMILAAGRGERLRPRTDHIPKPLIEVGGKSLIVWNIEMLRGAGFRDLVINTGWLGEQLPARLGDGSEFGVKIRYSREPPEALGTGGGILNALPLLGDRPFLVVNGDVWADHPLSELKLNAAALARIVLVANPHYHPEGDFSLDGEWVSNVNRNLTFSGIGVYHPSLFNTATPGSFELAPLLRAAAERCQLAGQMLMGHWFNVGTETELQTLEMYLGTGHSN